MLSIFRDHLRSSLFSNALFLYGGNIVPAVAGFVFWTLASRLYLANDVGISSVVIAAASLVSWIASVGTNMGLIRFLPEAFNGHRMINSVLSMNLVFSIVCGLFFLLGTPIWANHLRDVFLNIPLTLVFMIFIISSTWYTTIQACFIAYRKSSYALLYAVITNVMRIVLVIIAIKLGSLGLVGSTSSAFLVTYFVSLFFFMPRVAPGYRWSLQFNWEDIKDLLPFSGSNYLTMFSILMTQMIIPIMTLQKLGADANAYSYMAIMIGIQIAVPGTALAISAFAEGSNDLRGSVTVIRKSLAVSMIVTVVGSLVVVIAAPWLLAIFGSDYALEGSSLLRWLAIASPFIVVMQFIFTYLRLHRRNWLLLTLSIVLVFSILSTAYLLMPHFGITANGIGIFIGHSVMAILSLVVIKFF